MDLTKHLDSKKVIYVMKDWRSPDWYKIGCTANLRARYGAKRTREGIVHIIPVPDELNLFAAESLVHKMFSGKNVNGFETFALNENDLQAIRSIKFYGEELGVLDGDKDLQEMRPAMVLQRAGETAAMREVQEPLLGSGKGET